MLRCQRQYWTWLYWIFEEVNILSPMYNGKDPEEQFLMVSMTSWRAAGGLRFRVQVYAVEFTDMAKHARRLVAKNGVDDVVDVIQSSVEELELPGKVRHGLEGALDRTPD